MYRTIEYIMERIRKDKPIHLLGIGGIADIFHGVRQGIDTFDCVHPTRLGRHGCALVKSNYWLIEHPTKKPKESIDLKKSIFRNDKNIIDNSCNCETCSSGYSRMYINYLLKMNESLAGTLISIHNIFYMNELMTAIRTSIEDNTLDEIEDIWLVDDLKYKNRKTMNISCD